MNVREIYVDVIPRGEKGKHKLKDILVDTGATFTVLPADILRKVDALHYKVEPRRKLKLGDGGEVETDLYIATLALADREAPTFIVTFNGAQPVVGVRALEDLGLKVDPVKGKLEPTRPKGVAYFYHLELKMLGHALIW